MIDKELFAVLKAVVKLSPDARYRIVCAEDVCGELDFPLDEEAVAKTVRELGERDLISLRFDGGGEYCLAVTPRGRAVAAFSIDNEKKPLIIKPYIYLFLVVFFAVFLALLLFGTLFVC